MKEQNTHLQYKRHGLLESIINKLSIHDQISLSIHVCSTVVCPKPSEIIPDRLPNFSFTISYCLCLSYTVCSLCVFAVRAMSQIQMQQCTSHTLTHAHTHTHIYIAHAAVAVNNTLGLLHSGALIWDLHKSESFSDGELYVLTEHSEGYSIMFLMRLPACRVWNKKNIQN